jgi:ribosomal protein S18 acetylase RimI-like enzyme
MTRDTHEITEQEQLRWWTSRSDDLRLFLFRLGELAIGYGLTREDRDGAMIVSGGLHPDWRSMGIGYPLFSLLTLTWQPRQRYVCRLEVRRDNWPARTTYERIGFNYADYVNGALEGEPDILKMELIFL